MTRSDDNYVSQWQIGNRNINAIEMWRSNGNIVFGADSYGNRNLTLTGYYMSDDNFSWAEQYGNRKLH